MTVSEVSKAFKKIASSWPPDPVHPNMQLRNFLVSLADHPDLTSEAIQAAKALRSNELQYKYPLSKKTLHPPYDPDHYTYIAESFEKSKQGIARPWWKIFFNIR